MKKSNKILYNLFFIISAILVTFFIADIFDLSIFSSLAGSIPATYAIAPFFKLEYNADACNMAGISTVVYVIRSEDVLTMPSLAGVTDEGIVTYAGDFVLKPNKFWITCYSTQELGEFKGETQGPRDGKSWKNSGLFFYPNITKKSIALANTKLIYRLVQKLLKKIYEYEQILITSFFLRFIAKLQM